MPSDIPFIVAPCVTVQVSEAKVDADLPTYNKNNYTQVVCNSNISLMDRHLYAVLPR